MTYVELLGRLAQGSIVLFDKVPADLILGEVAVPRSIARGVDRGWRGRVLLGGALVLLLVGEVTVRRHGCPLRKGEGRREVSRCATGRG